MLGKWLSMGVGEWGKETTIWHYSFSSWTHPGNICVSAPKEKLQVSDRETLSPSKALKLLWKLHFCTAIELNRAWELITRRGLLCPWQSCPSCPGPKESVWGKAKPEWLWKVTGTLRGVPVLCVKSGVPKPFVCTVSWLKVTMLNYSQGKSHCSTLIISSLLTFSYGIPVTPLCWLFAHI